MRMEHNKSYNLQVVIDYFPHVEGPKGDLIPFLDNAFSRFLKKIKAGKPETEEVGNTTYLTYELERKGTLAYITASAIPFDSGETKPVFYVGISSDSERTLEKLAKKFEKQVKKLKIKKKKR